MRILFKPNKQRITTHNNLNKLQTSKLGFKAIKIDNRGWQPPHAAHDFILDRVLDFLHMQ